MAETEKALDKIDIASELKTLSPIEKRSLELKQMAEEIEISDKETYKEAKKVRRELISHRTSTKDLRLTFTRKLDNLKDQFIKKQDAVLEPSIAGEETIKQKIASWEREEQERKEAEEKRMQAIVDTFKMPAHFDRKTATVDDVNRIRAYIKAELSLLATSDRNKVAVKNAVAELRQKLDDEQAYILDRIEQEKEAARQAEERKKLQEEQAEAARKEKEEAAKNTPPAPASTPVAEPDKESSEPIKESESAPVPTDVQGGMDALVTNPARDMAKKIADAVDEEMTAFLKKQGYEVDPNNVQATVDLIRAKGYRVIDEVERQYEGALTRTKHTYLYVQVIDQTEFVTEARISMEEE
jgi:hypothetical protein